jgi:hypothetical protein
MSMKARIDTALAVLKDYQRPITSVSAVVCTFVGYFTPMVPADKLAVMASIGGLYFVLRSVDKRLPPPGGTP